ncbi:hypothetical protein RO3G_14124 [Rhizopus delemar RA 99-880]|uniref:HMG box domain-containing protein n=1 Tax=Rhizopus delemar (strain RA 99-880 / ATCC MYA-4621 / FGSC 9543 / NRRL 43880) TaxID=246409 RepID=I1CLT3_RHIO9|nr:hypothetical protein RO3G_14124 [Rhizopus delemar RA 99-880]|eukprot:EIE89413.1 hypothetical protein RO3G_14124 [Rhizopus delemar RA 99-880]
MAKEKVSKKATKKLSPYNNFIKAELAKVKKETPGISHKDAENWKDSPENPKNKKDNAAPAAK